jgi:outer membrane protein TolC
LYQQEKVKLAQQTLDRAKVNLDNGNIRLTNGKALINDINRLALDVSNAELSLRKTQQDNALAWSELKYRMQVPEETNLVLAETLPLLLKNNTNLDATINNTTIKSEQIALTDNQLQIEKSLKQNAFSVSAYGNFSLLALNENISPFSYVGVKVSKPLYDGKLAKLTAEDFTIKQQINQINLEKIQSDLNFELKTARKKVEQAQLDLLESEKNTTLARQIYQTDQLRFEQGALLQNDLKSSELSLQTAENNYLIAIYNILLASLEVKKVTGNW